MAALAAQSMMRTQKQGKGVEENFSRFEKAQETMNTGNLLAAQKVASAITGKKH